MSGIALPARKGGLRTWLWRVYIRHAFKGAFAALHLRGAQACAPLPDRPTLFCANHCGWWDGFIAQLVMESILGYDGYVPMEEVNLRRYPSMTRLGAFGLDRGNNRQAMRALSWAAQTLTETSGRGLWIFPQGALRPQDERPLKAEGGAAWLAEKTGARLVPVAVRYAFCDLQLPEVFVSLGEAIEPGGDREATQRALAVALEAEVDRLRDDVARERFDRGAPALTGRVGVDVWWSRLKAGLRPRLGPPPSGGA